MKSLNSNNAPPLNFAMIKEQSFEGRQQALNCGNKLCRTYALHLEALDKHRGKGQQKVTVEHVHEHQGGQAIVGDVHTGAGMASKPEVQPHAIAYSPEPEMRSAFKEKREAMPMRVDMAFLTTQPLWLGVLLVGAATLLAMAGPVLVRQRLSLDRLRLNNEVAGFMFATVGVLYAVLLAFAVIIAWERFSKAEDVVAQEAGAATTLYRLADNIGGDPGAALRDG